MAFITFLGRKKAVGIYRLSGTTTVGRSLDCDVYVPDVYLSRKHCRFEQHDGSWRVVDLGSSNGLWMDGEPLKSCVLKPGDTIEIGTVAVVFNEGEPDGASKPAPFGMGFGAAELMDTVCTQGIRPSDYSKRQTARKAEFANRARRRVTEEEERAELVGASGHDPFEITWQQEEWAELDMEVQVAESQEAALETWRAPIFNPSPDLLRLARELAVAKNVAAPAAPPAAGQAMTAHGTSAMKTTMVDYGLTESASPVQKGKQTPAPAPAASPAAVPIVPSRKRGLLAAAFSWLPLGRKTVTKNAEGCVFEKASRWDRVKDSVAERIGEIIAFAKRNPSLAGAAAMVLLVAIGSVVKFAPIGKSGPHIYIPPTEEKSLASVR